MTITRRLGIGYAVMSAVCLVLLVWLWHHEFVEEHRRLVGDAIACFSIPAFPITSARLSALIEETHFSCEKLLTTGFRHPETLEEGLMITKAVLLP